MKYKILLLILSCSFAASSGLAQPDGTYQEQLYDSTSWNIVYPTGIVTEHSLRLPYVASIPSVNYAFRQPRSPFAADVLYRNRNIPSRPGLSYGDKDGFYEITFVPFDVSVVQPATLFDHPGSRVVLHLGQSYLHRITDFDPFQRHLDYRGFSPRNISEFENQIDRFRMH